MFPCVEPAACQSGVVCLPLSSVSPCPPGKGAADEPTKGTDAMEEVAPEQDWEGRPGFHQAMGEFGECRRQPQEPRKGLVFEVMGRNVQCSAWFTLESHGQENWKSRGPGRDLRRGQRQGFALETESP